MDKYIQEYYELVKMDKDFHDKYITKKGNDLKSQFINFINDSFIWRKINSVEDIYNILNTENAGRLLQIEDFYSDMIDDFYEEDYHKDITKSIGKKENPEKAYSDDNYRIIFNDNRSSQKLKDCIEIYLKSEGICKNLYHNFIKNKKVISN